MTGIYYKDKGVLELLDEKREHLADFIIDEEDQWFSTEVNNKHYNFNLIGEICGVFECNKIGENSYETGDFIGQLNVEIK